MKGWLLSAFLLSITLLTPRVEAFVDPPYITPQQPTPRDTVSVHVRMGGCHASWDDVDEARLTLVAPGQLHLVTDGAALPPGHPFCIYDPAFTYRFDIGKLPAGQYTLHFFIFDDFSSPAPVEFGSVDFRVAEPARIPATSVLTLFAIAASVIVAAVRGYARLGAA